MEIYLKRAQILDLLRFSVRYRTVGLSESVQKKQPFSWLP